VSYNQKRSMRVLPAGQGFDFNSLVSQGNQFLGQMTGQQGQAQGAATPATGTNASQPNLGQGLQGLFNQLTGQPASTGGTTMNVNTPQTTTPQQGLQGLLSQITGQATGAVTGARGGACGQPGSRVRIAQRMYLRNSARTNHVASDPVIAAGSTITLVEFTGTAPRSGNVTSELWKVRTSDNREGWGLLATPADCTSAGGTDLFSGLGQGIQGIFSQITGQGQTATTGTGTASATTGTGLGQSIQNFLGQLTGQPATGTAATGTTGTTGTAQPGNLFSQLATQGQALFGQLTGQTTQTATNTATTAAQAATDVAQAGTAAATTAANVLNQQANAWTGTQSALVIGTAVIGLGAIGYVIVKATGPKRPAMAGPGMGPPPQMGPVSDDPSRPWRPVPPEAGLGPDVWRRDFPPRRSSQPRRSSPPKGRRALTLVR
jgi:hypothetical protein